MEGAPAFADARSCKEWLGVLPLTNIPQAQALLLEQLRALNASTFDPLERLKCLELMREKVSFLQGEQRSRYFGKTLPLSANDSQAWTTGRTLLEEMEAGYRRTAESAGGALASHAGLIAQRIVRYIGAQMLFHAIVYRRFDPQLWTRLHEQYLAAEGKHLEAEAVKDSLESQDGNSSVMEAYVKVVLIQASFLSEMTAPQIDFAEALLRMWVRRVKVTAAKPAAEGAAHPLVVDLSKPIGARPLAGAELDASHRVVEIEQLSRSIRKRIHGIQHDEDAVALGLPPEAAAVDALNEFKRLHKLWCEGAPPRPAAKLSAQANAGLVFGLGDIHFFVGGGKVFEQPDRKPRELTRQEKQDIEMFGYVREQTQTKMSADHNYSVEPWQVVDEMLGAVRVLRPNTASRGIAIGRLVGIRLGDTGPFFLGVVSELVHETDGRIIVTVRMLPGRPEPIAVRAGDARNRANAQWAQGFRLPPLEKLKIPGSIIVPSGMGIRGRGVDIWLGAAKESTVEEVVERGSDFERVTVF